MTHSDLSVVDHLFLDLSSNPIKNATKNRILDCAIEQFSRKGYTGVSIRDITREVGIKESSLYKHFRNKEEILETIFHNFRLDTLRILPPLDRLDEILELLGPVKFLERGLHNFKQHAADPIMQKIWRILYIEQYREPVARDLYLNDILTKTIDCLEAAFVKLIEHQRCKPLHPRTLAVEYQYPIFTMISEYIMLKSDQQDTAHVEQMMSDHLTFFCMAVLV